MRAQVLLTATLLIIRAILAYPTFLEIKRLEIDNTKPIGHQDIKIGDHDPSVARDLLLPAAINQPIPIPGFDLPGATLPPPDPTSTPSVIQPVIDSAPATPIISGSSQLSLDFPLLPAATQDPGTTDPSTTDPGTTAPGTTTLAIISLPGLVVVPFTFASSGPAAFSGVATPVGSASAINPVPEG